MLDILKSTNDKSKVEDKLYFEYKDGSWVLVKSKKFFDLMLFYCNTPDLITEDEWTDDTDPYTEPDTTTPIETVTYDQFLGAMDYYLYELMVCGEYFKAMNEYMDVICFEYDYNGDGSPEMCVFGKNAEADVCYVEFCEYIPSMDGICFYNYDIPEACVNPDEYGSYSLFITGDKIVLMYSYIEGDMFISETQVLGYNFFPVAYYRSEIDLTSDSEVCYSGECKEYGDEEPMDADEYYDAIEELIDSATLIFMQCNCEEQFAPGTAYCEEVRTYDEAVEYYESFQ